MKTPDSIRKLEDRLGMKWIAAKDSEYELEQPIAVWTHLGYNYLRLNHEFGKDFNLGCHLDTAIKIALNGKKHKGLVQLPVAFFKGGSETGSKECVPEDYNAWYESVCYSSIVFDVCREIELLKAISEDEKTQVIFALGNEEVQLKAAELYLSFAKKRRGMQFAITTDEIGELDPRKGFLFGNNENKKSISYMQNLILYCLGQKMPEASLTGTYVERCVGQTLSCLSRAFPKVNIFYDSCIGSRIASERAGFIKLQPTPWSLCEVLASALHEGEVEKKSRRMTSNREVSLFLAPEKNKDCFDFDYLQKWYVDEKLYPRVNLVEQKPITPIITSN